MLAKNEVAPRHLPTARARDARPVSAGAELARMDVARERRRTSESRLQVAVAKPPARDELDPYADVPCTD